MKVRDNLPKRRYEKPIFSVANMNCNDIISTSSDFVWGEPEDEGEAC